MDEAEEITLGKHLKRIIYDTRVLAFEDAMDALTVFRLGNPEAVAKARRVIYDLREEMKDWRKEDGEV